MRSLLRLLVLARELWPYYVAIAVTAALATAAAMATPFIIKDATDAIVAQLQGKSNAWPHLGWLAAGLLFVSIVHALINGVGGHWGDVMATKLKAILSSRYFAKTLTLPQRYFDEQLTGTIINRLTRSLAETTQFFQAFSNNFLSMVLTVGAILVVTGMHSPWLSLLLLAIYPIFTWLTALTSRRWQPLEARKNELYDVAGGRFAEVVSQIRVVKSFTAEARELRLFNRRYAETVGITRKQSRFWHAMDFSRRAAVALIFFAVYLIIFTQTASGAFSVGVMVLLIQLVMMAQTPIMMMSYFVDSAQRAIAGSRDYLAALEEVSEPAAAIQEFAALSFLDQNSEAPTEVSTWPGDASAPAVAFDDVSFSYDGQTSVLTGVTFAISPGERVALVGESGSGKSTLVNLLLGLYSPASGTISLGGRDVTDSAPALARAHIGVVFQDAALFSGTVRENIAYGRPGVSDDEVEDAARRANAHSFIARLIDGYATEIGERGVKLSGGQKQRIAIARAMVKDAPILVLDEATSALDTKSERAVQAGLEELMADRTALIIAHRLSTISDVDRIITVRDGRIDEIGTPAALSHSGGIYAELLALQASATRADRKRLLDFDITN